MPVTKYSFIRYRILDRCFRNPVKRYQIQDLIDACNAELNGIEKGVSRRTIYYDIEFMKSIDGWDAPIEPVKDGNRTYYHYTDPYFSIDNSPINETQLRQMQSALDILSCFDGLPQFDGISESLSKIGMEVMNMKNGATPCCSIEHNEFLQGKEHLTVLFNAIQDEVALEIEYKPYDEETATHIFHPQFLKQYNNRWFVLGMSEDVPGQVRNLALDRIKEIKTLNAPYNKMDIDWNEYFDDIIGVTNIADAPIEDIHFLVTGKTGHYFCTKPIHGSQRARWIDDQTLDVHLSVKVNYELKRFLLSYAGEIKILAPQSIIEEHKSTLEKALAKY